MTDAPPTPERSQTVGEEIANSISHGAGFAAALVATPSLIADAVTTGSTYFVVGVAVFAVTVALLYLGSTLYHALPHGKAKETSRLIEHSAIYLLIAGTYTPFTLGALRGPVGWTLLGVIWTLALVGVLLQSRDAHRFRRVSMALYLGMGWLMVVAIRPLWVHVPLAGLLWLLAGGIAYTVGVGFYRARQLRYAHFIWHLFVLAGTASHYMAIRFYAMP